MLKITHLEAKNKEKETETYEYEHFTSILAWFCVNFLYNLTSFQKIKKSKKGDLKWHVKWRHLTSMKSLSPQMVSSFRASSGLSNQCEIILLCLKRMKTPMSVWVSCICPRDRFTTHWLTKRLSFLLLAMEICR